MAPNKLAILDQLEMVTAESPRLLGAGGAGHGAAKAVGLAPRGAVGLVFEVTTWDVNPGVRPELIGLDSERAELDAFGVAEEPGAVVIFLTLEHCDAELHVEGTALPA